MKRILSLLIIALFIPQLAFAAWPKIHGFVEADYGIKLSGDNTKRDNYNLLEQRLQLRATHYFFGDNYLANKGAVLNFRGDFLVDWYYSGKTDFELREANILLSPFRFMDLKAGRQILTWGTGDYLFINDQFPKDYESFYAGRDDEYLKKPSDAIKTSFYPKLANIDFIMMPYFTPNTLPKGDRLHFLIAFKVVSPAEILIGILFHRLFNFPIWSMPCVLTKA